MSSSNYFSGFNAAAGNPVWCHEHFCWAEYHPDGHYLCPQGHQVEVFDRDDVVVIRNGLETRQRLGLNLIDSGPFTVVNVERVPENEEPTWGHNQFLHIVSGDKPRRLSAFYFTHAA